MLYITGNIHELGELIRYCEITKMTGMCNHCPFRTFLSALDDKCVAPLEDLLVVENDTEGEENE